MQQQAPHQRHPAYYWIVLGCVLSVVFWIAESGIEAGLFGEHSFSAGYPLKAGQGMTSATSYACTISLSRPRQGIDMG
jgi:hypothetical protein